MYHIAGGESECGESEWEDVEEEEVIGGDVEEEMSMELDSQQPVMSCPVLPQTVLYNIPRLGLGLELGVMYQSLLLCTF